MKRSGMPRRRTPMKRTQIRRSEVDRVARSDHEQRHEDRREQHVGEGDAHAAQRTPPKRRRAIKPVSDKRRIGGAERREQVAAAFERDGWRLVDGNRWVGGRCIPAERGMPGKCFGPVTPHRLQKGSAGGGYTTENVVSACSFHNDDIENRPNEARALGLVVTKEYP